VAAEFGEKRWWPGLGKEVIGGDLAHPGSIPPVEMLRAIARIPWWSQSGAGQPAAVAPWRRSDGGVVVVAHGGERKKGEGEESGDGREGEGRARVCGAPWGGLKGGADGGAEW
jgi:hypothetical protein